MYLSWRLIEERETARKAFVSVGSIKGGHYLVVNTWVGYEYYNERMTAKRLPSGRFGLVLIL